MRDKPNLGIQPLDRPKHMPSRIAARLLKEIADGRLGPGDKLPGEQDLADSFGVSRNVVREALSRLKADGVVQTQQGKGAFVAQATANSSLRFDAEAMRDLAVYRNMFELRASLETDCAALASLRRTDEQLSAIAAGLAAMKAAPRWDEGGVDADLSFHNAVAEATNNSQIAQVVKFLIMQMRFSISDTRSKVPEPDAIWSLTIGEHDRIYLAIRNRDPRAARAAMLEHIINAASRIGCELDHTTFL